MVYTVRQRCGQQLAEEAPVNVDIVSTVPESATPAALAYAEKVKSDIIFLSFSVEFFFFQVCIFHFDTFVPLYI